MWLWWHAALIAVGGSLALVGVVVVGIVAWNGQRARARLRAQRDRLIASGDS
jgi:hypothetical protein